MVGPHDPTSASLDWAISVITDLDTENDALRGEITTLEGALADAAWEINRLTDQLNAANAQLRLMASTYLTAQGA